MPLIDSHAHLDFSDFGEDLAATLRRAREAGLVHVVVVGQWREPDERRPGSRAAMAAARDAVELARTDRSFLSATAGIHPHDAARATAADLRELEAIAREPDCVAVGECGLDYHYDRSPRDVQRELFAAQVRLAKALRKTARLWDARTGAPRGAAMGHEDRVVAAAFSPNGDLVLTASWDRTAESSIASRVTGRRRSVSSRWGCTSA